MTQTHHGLTRLDNLIKECLQQRALNDEPLPQIFGRLMRANPITGSSGNEQIIAAFDALVEAMRTTEVEDGPADAGMTFFGQFIDHDITLDVESAIGTRIDPRTIRNVRTPALDLDCVYGDGPEGSPHLYSEKHHGFLLFGREDNPRDLARTCRGVALIGDPRNDENVIVSQLQGAFITLHNILMSMVEEGGQAAADVHNCAQMGIRQAVWQDLIPSRLRSFEEVRRFVRLHYQWLVVNQLLPSFVDKAELDKALAGEHLHRFQTQQVPVMPVEFSGAAYRFGHATVQARYVLREGHAPVDLFREPGFQPRTPDSDLEFARFFAMSGSSAQAALPVGTKMAASLFELPFVTEGMRVDGVSVTVQQAKKLGLRNILRDRYALELPSGQQVARQLQIPERAAPDILKDRHIDKTPLWFYCLQEAAEVGNGRLKGVGAAILGTVFGRLLKLDEESVWHLPDFMPWSGFGGDACTMGSVMAFVEANRDNVAHAADLRCG